MSPFIVQKTQEICFALIRVAAHIRRFELRQTIERFSYHLLENISYQNSEMGLLTIDSIRNFISLGKNIYEVETVNAKILDRELEHLAQEIRRSVGPRQIPDLETVFTQKIAIHKDAKKSEPIPSEVVVQESEIGNEEIEIEKYGNAESDDSNSALRMEKIISLIKNAPDQKISFKEIAMQFPEVTDRTIRNDIKKLNDEGAILRQGSGGPGNYYTLPPAESNVIPLGPAPL